MMDLRGIRDHLASLFVMLNQKKYIMFRVESLVVVVTTLFLAMFIMDIFRRHFHSSITKAIFSLLDGASTSILVYLLGVMQTAKFKNDLFPVWMLVLIMLRYSIGFISGSGVPDPSVEATNVTNLILSFVLNLTLDCRFQHPLLSLLVIQMLRSLYRYGSHVLKMRSYWHDNSSELISEYMREDRDPRNWQPEECNPLTMEGYRYLVYGERARLNKPEYVLRIIRSSLITLDKIWRCRGHLLRSRSDSNRPEGEDNNHGGKDLKDISMAFALSRLLRARLQDVILQRGIRRINRKLVQARIIEERDKQRAFGIIELQLSFVNDYFNTRYPMVFWSGLGSLFLCLLQSVATIGVVCWLSVDIYKVQGNNAAKFITIAFMLLLIFKEFWEMVIYLLSDWTRLLLVCMYVKGNDKPVRNRCIERLILCFFRSKISDKRWHGLLDQYVFMQSYSDRPKFCNLVHKVTLGIFPERYNGATLGSAIHIPEYIRPTILEKLRVILEQQRLFSQDDITEQAAEAHRSFKHPATTESCLPPVIMTLCEGTGQRKDLYGWACFNMRSSSHIILVWHIATSLCEMALAKKHGVDMTKPGCLRSLVSYFTCCCPSKSYLIDVDDEVLRKDKKKETKFSLLSCFTGCCWSKWNKKKDKLADELEKRYIIANSLSRYGAYLLISKPDLIPDSYLVPEMVFQAAVKSARDDILKGCDSLETRYTKLMLEAYRAAEDSNNDVKKSNDVVRQGALLDKELINHEGDEGCWEILAGVWTELLIHIAPTWNAEAHKGCLESGGEFITIIWSLLWHCGIEKSSLWPENDVPEDDPPTAPQDSHAGQEVVQQAGADNIHHPVGTEIHEESEIKATEDPDAANLRTGSRAVPNGTGSLEIEEASSDSAGQTQMFRQSWWATSKG